MIDLIKSLALNNPVLQGALSLTITGAALFLLKTIPIKAYEFFVEQMTTTVNITNYNMSYYKFLKWFQQQNFIKYSRMLQVFNGAYGHSDTSTLSIGQGVHYAFFKNKMMKIIVSRSREGNSDKVKEELNVTYFGRNYDVAKNLVEEISKTDQPNPDKYIIYSYGEYWSTRAEDYKRKFSTVFLKETIKNQLFNHIDTFLLSKNKYIQAGVPYKTTILLHGPPGTGKTSIIKALADKYNKDLALLPTSVGGKLQTALCTAPAGCILVMEDVDSMNGTQDRVNATPTGEIGALTAAFSEASSSAVLNALDGIGSFTDKIFIMTTNHLDKLDPAFLRPGRVDLILEIPPLDLDTLVNHTGDRALASKLLNTAARGCDLQKFIFRNDIRLN